MRAILLVIVLLALNGCTEQAATPPVQQQKPPAVNVSQQTGLPDTLGQASSEVETKGVAYSYRQQGRKDPFKSPLYGIKEKKTAGLTPLQQRSLGELRVIGLVWGTQGFIAMIETPDGKGFVIKEGTLVGPDGGVVKKISNNAVIIEESYVDYYGKKVSKKTVLGLRSREESGG